MTKSALVLNKNWVPIATTSLFGAMRLLCRDSASIIDVETYERFDLGSWIAMKHDDVDKNNSIKLSTGIMKTPEVILLTNYGGVPYKTINWSRRNLYKRDKYKCQYCNMKFPSSDLTIDHVIPKSRGGVTSWENCVSACMKCNMKKADRSIAESGMKLIKQPAAPKWNPIVSFLPPVYPSSWDKFIKT